MVQKSFGKLRTAKFNKGEEPLAIELVFATPKSARSVSTTIRKLLPDAKIRVEHAFEKGVDDRFLFVEFEDIPPEGQEPEAFAFARELRKAMKALEANPILADSLYGATAISPAGDEEGFFNFCSTAVNDELPDGWVHPIIDTPSAWKNNTGEKATVAVIDTGYSSHDELKDAIKKTGQLNLVEGGTDASDRFSGGLLTQPGHGTTVCSVVASRGSADEQGNTTGPGRITGSAPGSKLLPIRAIKSVINFRQKTIPKAIEHAIKKKADVIVMALGGPTRVSATEMALRRANEAGIVTV
ncbi:MAG: S8 family peptidase, partial [Rhizobiaceae bacterium]